MNYVIFNKDGSVKNFCFTEIITKNSNTGKIFAGVDGLSNESYTASANFELPNGDASTLLGTPSSEEIDGSTFYGYRFGLTAQQTAVEGNVLCSIVLRNAQEVLYTYEVILTINPSVGDPYETAISVAQYNNLQATLASLQPKYVLRNARFYPNLANAQSDLANLAINQCVIVADTSNPAIAPAVYYKNSQNQFVKLNTFARMNTPTCETRAFTLDSDQEATASVVVETEGSDWSLSFVFGIPRGVQGERGEKGEKGDKGDSGNSFTITGQVNSVENLPSAETLPLGTAYFVGTQTPRNVYVIVYVNGVAKWEDEGTIQGAKGDKGEKGDKGDKGDTGANGATGATGATGAPAGFGEPTAQITGGVGTPSVSVSASGPNTAKVFNFVFSNLKGERGETPEVYCADGNDIGTSGTPSVTRSVLGNKTTFTFHQLKGASGADGVSVDRIEKTGTDGLVDTYTIYYSDNSTSTFQVTNGANGADGNNGSDGVSISSVTKTSTSGLVDTYTIAYSDGNTSTFDVTNGADGQKGDTGDTGATGNGISSITKTGTSGLVDTYTITFTNGNTTTFQVTNGIMSATQFGYANQDTAYADFSGEAGQKTINVTISSNHLPMGVRLYDYDSNPMNYICWRRTSATNVQIIMNLGSSVSPDEPCTAYVDYINLV